MVDDPLVESHLAWLSRQLTPAPLLVGYSGGLDSHVLLHWLATQQPVELGYVLQALHVDHGLQAASAAWGEHCAAVCRALQVPLRVCRVDARPAPGESPEAAARRARYAAFAADLGPDAALLTAHHHNDQAETLLFRLARGTGLHGAGGIRPRRPGYCRPLLGLTRAETEALCAAFEQGWVTDARCYAAPPGSCR